MNPTKLFAVGLTIETMFYVPAPYVSPLPYQKVIPALDGSTGAFGFPSLLWRYGFISEADRTLFRNICPGASVQCYVRSRYWEGDETSFRLFYGWMYWPLQEDPFSGSRIDWRLEFKYLTVVEE